MRLLVLLFILFPAATFGAEMLKFNDGSSLCGNYVESGKTYCKTVAGGEFCVKKSDIAAVKTVNECEESNASGKSTDYLNKHNQSQIDWVSKKSSQDETNRAYYKEPARKTPKTKY